MMGKLWTRTRWLETLRNRRSRGTTRLLLESLEDRAVPASLAGQVYIDSNFDGFKQASEAGLSGVTLQLTGTDIDGGSVDQTTTSGSDGTFSFTIAKAGTYTVTQTQPGGFLTAFETAGTAGGTVASNVISDITLTESQIATGYLFGERGIRVTGKVFTDTNANGVLDGAETGLTNMLVTLTNTGSGNSTPVLTDANGDYSFEGLAPGNYTASVTNNLPLLGFTTASTQNVNISSSGAPGGEIANQNFGLSPVSELRGVVYHDVNNNGVFDAGDVGINNVQLNLNGTQNNAQQVNRQLNTAPDGTFRFQNLIAGTYSISQTQPNGFDDGVISIGTAGGAAGPNIVVGINLGAGITATGYNFGERQVQSSTLSGRTFIDVNGDGQKQSNEPGLSGVLFQLTGTNDLNEPVNLNAVSDSNGNFTFSSLRPGTYTLTQTQPQNFATGITTAGSAGGTVNGNAIETIVIGSGVTATDYLFGEEGNRASGTLFNDNNANGVLDGGDTGRGGVLLTLTNTTTNTTFNTVSAADGTFLFEDLGPGSYTLTATNPDANELAFTNGGSLNFSIPNDGVAGGQVQNQNLGLTELSELSGVVYRDENNNGIFDAGDIGISGVQIRLQGTQNNGTSINRTLNTLADGTFRFTGVIAGTYSLTQTQPAGFDDGTITVGTAGGSAGPNVVVGINLGVNVTATGYHFGERFVRTSSLSGRTFIDVNGDGQKQSNEPGLAGVVFQITGTNDLGNPVNETVTSDSSGNFTFNGLRPGTYTLTQTQPQNFANGSTTAGTAGGTASGNSVQNIVLVGGETATDYLFAELGNRATGRVFNDLNANGVLDGGEAGRGGVLLTLTNTTTNTTFSTVSAADGTFLFEDLGPGSYTLTATNPDDQELAFTNGGTLNFSIPNDGVLGGEVQNQNLGLTEVSEISGVVFSDRNGNGIFDSGDVGINNVQIRLQGTQANGSSVNRTLNTQANGTFRFTGVIAGNYSLTQTQPSGFDDGTITVGTAGGTIATNSVQNIAIAPNVVATGYNFGEIEIIFSSLTGRVFFDRNGDGLFQAGEQTLSGVVLSLVGTANNGDPVNLSATTSSDGVFSFSNVRAGTYTLTQSQPANFADGSARAGTAGGIVNGNSISNIVLGNGVSATDYLFSEVGNRVAGTVFTDANGNGIFDAGEAGRAGVTVNLSGAGQNLSVVSDANGDYQFLNLGPGTYNITAVAPAGSQLTTASLTVTIPNSGVVGGEIIDRDLGLVQTARLAGNLFIDLNNDGIQQGNEPGFSSLQVTLTGVQANGSNVNRTAVSGENGRFLFENLLPGTYNLAPTLTAGVVVGQITIGNAGGTAGGSGITGITITPGLDADGYRFALRSSDDRTILTGKVFLDRNRNRRLDPGDLRTQDLTAGIEGVTIRLLGRDAQGNAVDLTTQTDFFGNYSFTNLRAGQYRLFELQPRGFREGKTFVGSLGGRARRNQIDSLTLNAGAIGSGYDFSELLPTVSRKSLIASRYWS